MPCNLIASFHSILTTALGGRHDYNTHFSDEEIDTERSAYCSFILQLDLNPVLPYGPPDGLKVILPTSLNSIPSCMHMATPFVSGVLDITGGTLSYLLYL